MIRFLAALGLAAIWAFPAFGQGTPIAIPPLVIGAQSLSPGATVLTQGNGGKIQLSTGNVTTGHCAQFDSNGNTVDAGAPCGTGGGGAVSSVFGRTGAVIATSGDYSFSLISGTVGAAQMPIATVSTLGAIIPDGTTITINPSTGVASAVGGTGCTVAGTSGQVVYNSGSGGCASSSATVTSGGALTLPGTGTASAPNLTIGTVGYGMYYPGTTGEFCIADVANSCVMDYGITVSAAVSTTKQFVSQVSGAAAFKASNNSLASAVAYAVGSNSTGMYSTSNSANLAFSVGSTNRLDYAITNAGDWTASVPFVSTYLGASTLAAATSNTLCYSTTQITGYDVLATCSSLRALKDHAESMQVTLDDAMALKPLQYHSKTSGNWEYGMFAEDVQEWDSLIQRRHPQDKTLLASYARGKLTGVDYMHLAAIDLKLIQDLNRRVDEINRAHGCKHIWINHIVCW